MSNFSSHGGRCSHSLTPPDAGWLHLTDITREASSPHRRIDDTVWLALWICSQGPTQGLRGYYRELFSSWAHSRGNNCLINLSSLNLPIILELFSAVLHWTRAKHQSLRAHLTDVLVPTSSVKPRGNARHFALGSKTDSDQRIIASGYFPCLCSRSEMALSQTLLRGLRIRTPSYPSSLHLYMQAISNFSSSSKHQRSCDNSFLPRIRLHPSLFSSPDVSFRSFLPLLLGEIGRLLKPIKPS